MIVHGTKIKIEGSLLEREEDLCPYEAINRGLFAFKIG